MPRLALGGGVAAALLAIFAISEVSVVGAPFREGGGTADQPEFDAPPVYDSATDDVLALEITAQQTAFTPSPLAGRRTYTSVFVTVLNNGDEPVAINPLYFSITGADGVERSASTGRGMDANEIDTLTLLPDEAAKGAISAEGILVPQRVSFQQRLTGPVVQAQVEPGTDALPHRWDATVPDTLAFRTGPA